ncbi:class I SAM-dependent methyltransferase [Phototrophicus methaneseepsis]|uniref:Class I SAM-dependent methyltransferase n=1 Tax=Phototrophicus methaneseepsis TaxID=2710758 RepID=A0A7S8E9D4_9CHLR|nr:CmcI family methyltransferase [Phototrophicus methaneseepsis]QPC82796.1 class I SAM-dependent methyltransferase [Phototrophicus methaneseepsis]
MFAQLVKPLLKDSLEPSQQALLDEIEPLIETIHNESIQGDIVFYQPTLPHALILSAAILQAHGDHHRRIALWQPQFTISTCLTLFQKYQLELSRLVIYQAPAVDDTPIAFLHLSAVPKHLATITDALSPGGYIVSTPPEAHPQLSQITRLQQTEGHIWRVPYDPLQAKVAQYRAEYRPRLQQSLRTWARYHQRELIFRDVHWMGQPTLKNVMDCWIYQEVIYEVQPEVIVEIGSFSGGSTLFFAHMLDLLGAGKVVSVDINRHAYNVSHDRIIEVTGDSTTQEVMQQVRQHCAGKRTLVIHDGDHRHHTVLTDLNHYAPLVTPGSYLIVEDGIVDIYPYEETGAALEPDFQDKGPLWAVATFMAENPQFTYDRTRERYWLTYNPFSFLKRLP